MFPTKDLTKTKNQEYEGKSYKCLSGKKRGREGKKEGLLFGLIQEIILLTSRNSLSPHRVTIKGTEE